MKYGNKNVYVFVFCTKEKKNMIYKTNKWGTPGARE